MATPGELATFLFTDIEGSTRLWDRAPADMASALPLHDGIILRAVGDHGGTLVKHTGDGILAAFDDPAAAVLAAVAAQHALNAGPWPGEAALRVRMAIHTGDAERRGDDFFGPALNRAARILDASHGGQVLVSESAAARIGGTLPESITLRALGEHRLKDLARAETLYQVLAAGLRTEFPTLRTLEAVPNNLPIQLTDFVGRRMQLEEVTEQLRTHRLVTLSGVGGVGKSRLALQAAADLLDAFPGGVWLVELAALADPLVLPKAVAQAVGVREESDRPIVDALVGHLRSRRVLLVLDNCEHLIDAVASLAEQLLRFCPDLRILATSREGLGISGELLRQVPPLRAPEPDTPFDRLEDFEAVELFLSRARSVQPDFELTSGNAAAVIEVCHRLDGIALALELAAARLRVLSVRQIAERLDDRFRLLTGGSRTALPRQRTLQATMDWSHDLLGVPEQVLFRRLAVFQGGFGVEAVERVCTDELVPEGHVLELVARLVDESLLVTEGSDHLRYRMLETVRQYGQDKLAASGEADLVRGRHAEWVAYIADRVEEALRSTDQTAWVELLEAERGNVRAALLWADEAGAFELGLRIAAGMGRFWYLFGPYAEGRRWLGAMLAGADQRPSRRRAMALRWEGTLAWMQGRLDEAEAAAAAAMETAEQVGDGTTKALGRMLVGFVAESRGDAAAAASRFREALAELEALGEHYWASIVLTNLESVVRRMGDPEQSRALAEELVAAARRQGDGRLAGLAYTSLALNALHMGDVAAFRRHHATGLVELDRVGQQVWKTQSLVAAAYTAVVTGFPDLADELSASMVEEATVTHHPDSLAAMHTVRGVAAFYRGRWEEADRELQAAISLHVEHGAPEAATDGQILRASVALGRGDVDRAIEHAANGLLAARSIGSRGLEVGALNALAAARLARDETDEAEGLARQAAILAGRSKDLAHLARSAETLAAVAARAGNAGRTIRLLASATYHRDRLRLVRSGPEQRQFDDTLDRARYLLGADEVARLWTEGACESLPELVTCCLEPAEAVA
jgi:predicted ATPase/class 3 adenylate cyclase